MRRLQITLAALFLGIGILGCKSLPSRPDLGGMYYLNGVNRHDGMSASIDLANKTMRVAGDGFVLRPCDAQDLTNRCISSDYFVLVLGPTEGSWAAQGETFTMGGTCSLSSARGDWQVSIVRSVQKYGAFRFYIGGADELIGWTLNHDAGTDHFLRQGIKLGTCSAMRTLE